MFGADLLEMPCDWQRGRGGQRGTFRASDTADEGIPRPARASRTARPAPRAPPASGSDATAPGVAPTGKRAVRPWAGEKQGGRPGNPATAAVPLLEEGRAKPLAEALQVWEHRRPESTQVPV